MMQRGLTGLLAAVLWLMPGGAAHGDEPVSTASLVTQAADMEQLTRHPAAGTRVVQFSSYDRRSNLPGGPGWFGNSDGFGGEPIPGFEAVARQPGADGIGDYVICDVQQPGAIVRTWTAAIEGTIRVYLDGSQAPVYDGPAQDFLMHHATSLGKSAGASGDTDLMTALGAFEQRYSDYFPIPFAKSCRIVWIGNLNTVHFYHVQLKLLPAGTAVKMFTPGDFSQEKDAILAAAKGLREPSAPTAESFKDSKTMVPPHDERQVLALEGPGAIYELQALVGSKDMAAALRGVLLKVSFDGFEAPQIVAPLGDFFGVSPGLVAFRTLPMEVTKAGVMTCRFVMPYQKSAVFTVVNSTETQVAVSLRAAVRPYQWDERSMYLRARWRVDHDLTARGSANAVDLPFLDASGSGVYVGTAVYLMNPCPVPTAGGNWWGEGDEKVYVDSEARPSIFGTGSEDYFNYAWSESDIFEYPYFSQPICTGPDTRGHITNTRWHVLDAIPFDHSISFAIELFAHTPTPHLSYARLSYWYGKPGAHEYTPGVNIADLRVAPLPGWTVRAAGGATNATIIEAEKARDLTGASSVVEDAQYSAGSMVRLTDATGSFKVSAPAAGKYRVVMTCVSGTGPINFDATIDDQALVPRGTPRYSLSGHPFVRIVNLWSEPLELTAGEHTLAIRNIEDPSRSGLGVDFLWLRPEK